MMSTPVNFFQKLEELFHGKWQQQLKFLEVSFSEWSKSNKVMYAIYFNIFNIQFDILIELLITDLRNQIKI